MRKSSNKILDGVCAGMAEHIGVDPVWVRLLFALGGFVWAYLILMLTMEEALDENS